MHKDLEIMYMGTEGLRGEEMKWVFNNLKNKEGLDKKNMVPIALGVGLNLWLNDRWGAGIQGDYLIMPYKNIANSLQGTIRIMYRLGGKSKNIPSEPVIQYIDRMVEVEKIVERPVNTDRVAQVLKVIERDYLLDNIHFEFDEAGLTPESNDILDKLARILKQDTSKRYLITGYTDAKGGDEYNMRLSEKRAVVVVKALAGRGVPKVMLKARGVSSKVASAKPAGSNVVRHGDRKITIELISNPAYWDDLPENDLVE